MRRFPSLLARRWLCGLLFVATLRANPAPAPNPVPEYRALAALSFEELKTALERAGWPAAHVQGILSAEIQRRLNPPAEVRDAELRPFEFWRTGPDAEALSPADLRQRDAERERREAAVRETFDRLFPATEPEESPALRRWREKREWGALSGEKRQAIAARLARADAERDAIMNARGGLLTRAEWHQVWKSQDQARADIEHLLTPEELLDYDLRASLTANRLRHELDNFQPTKDEFLALFRLRHPFDLRFATKPPGSDPDIDAERNRAAAEVDRKIAAALGPARYADYQLSLDPACQLLQHDGRFSQVDAPTVRALYRKLLRTREKLAPLGADRSADAEAARAAEKAALFAEFRRHFDEESARRFLQEQELWP